MPRSLSVYRMKKCIEMYENYQKELKMAKEPSSEKSKREFKFYEVPVLGTFHSFIKRLQSVS